MLTVESMFEKAGNLKIDLSLIAIYQDNNGIIRVTNKDLPITVVQKNKEYCKETAAKFGQVPELAYIVEKYNKKTARLIRALNIPHKKCRNGFGMYTYFLEKKHERQLSFLQNK